ncbi:MAG TPA: hypothetical protein VNN25_03710 [Thermoanaerobaculia bacterium]|nr:hypothetical protein [Thermoanaerobaculia bacterium]
MIAAAFLLAALTLPEVPSGAPVDRGEFLYARPLGTIPAGVVSLTLDAHVLLRSHALQDVRIVDAKGNQVPYLVIPLTAPTIVSLAIPPAAREGKQSVYRLTLPYESLPNGAELELTTSASVFERDVVLRRALDESRGREAEVIDRLSWKSMPSMRASLTGGRAIEVVVDEGDNAPLPIVSAKLRLPGFALRFVSPGTPLTLLYGNSSISAPRYDLALISSQLVGQPARAIALIGEPSTEPPAKHRESRLFGIAIGVAAAVLLIVLGRLVSAQRS